MKKLILTLTCLLLPGVCACAQNTQTTSNTHTPTAPTTPTTIRNDAYSITCNTDSTLSIQTLSTQTHQAPGQLSTQTRQAPMQTLVPEFAIMFSKSNPMLDENHSNYLLAPRIAMLWRGYEENEAALNARLNTPALRKDLRHPVLVSGAGQQRSWTWFSDEARQNTRLRVTGRYAQGTTDPFQAGERHILHATGARISGNMIQWTFPADRARPFDFAATLELPQGTGDPKITLQFRARRDGYFAAAFTGAPSLSSRLAKRIDQDTASNFHMFNYVVGEGALHLPLVCLGSTEGWASGLALDAANMPFVEPGTDRPRVPYRTAAYCGAMLRKDYKTGALQPVIFAPLMGGADSKMKSGDMRTTTVHYILRPGDWKNVYRHVAQHNYGNTDLRDNTGTGSLNRTLERLIDFMADRNGRNYAMWHAEQKYYDYVNDLPGSFKPFSPLFGLSLAIVFDDEHFYRTRVRPQVEFALSRNTNYFTPYEVERGTAMISKVDRGLGTPYPGYVQLVSLHGMYQNRNHALRQLAAEKEKPRAPFPELLAKHSLTNASSDLAAALAAAKADLAADPAGTRNHFMDWLDAWEASGDSAATRHTAFLDAALERIYNKIASTLTLAPAVPDANVTLDTDGFAPVHGHSIGRHKRWGFPKPLGYPTPPQTVPAWRGALNGLQGLGPYRAEFWMDNHGHLMRIGALAGDDFLASLARWGMVGRFAHYPGDNRTAISLLPERPELAENPLWKMTHATHNPGHAWEFSAAVLDFLIADVFKHSDGAIDFPSRSMSGATFRVRLHGDRPGTFYDDTGVMLWMPKGLATASSPHIDYISGYGNGKLYFAFVNQSVDAQDVEIDIDPGLADLRGAGEATFWINNKRQPAAALIASNRIRLTLPGRGIAACAIPGARIRRALHEKIFSPDAPVTGPGSLQRTPLETGASPSVTVTGMLLSLGKGLTHAYIYSGAQAADTQLARLRHRQGENAAWQETTDAIFPYEFSVDFIEGAGDIEYEYTLVTARGETCTTPLVRLSADFVGPDLVSGRARVGGRIGNSRPDTRSGPTSPPPPPPPAGLTAIAQNDGGVRLSWDAVPNATAYILKRTDVTSGPYFGPFVTVARDIRGTTHVDAGGFHMDTTLCYVVSAMTDAGESADSPMAKVIPRKGTPTAPKSRPPAALNTRWKCTQSFIDYMKEVTNPAKVGEYGKSAKDGRYYPYSTPYGRLIGYGSPPQKTADYTEGITEAEATARLVAALNDVAATLGARIPDRHPEKKFEHLSADMQEVLVDYGYTEGVENIPAPLIEAVYAPDAWERMARDMVYVRVRKGLIQFPKNKAFFERWLAPKGY